ncbi:hypothetical protein CDEST_06977 [Colletotrichum destructivum]|uniref:Uncharacterized protein n=1 Tax=Colletotrichum destructivum TaxID=34406 RepID=A0AAX4IEV1_9PEZI|nr:hypothetical protein CDEST_06977 [Colletotrichum destructivum]
MALNKRHGAFKNWELEPPFSDPVECTTYFRLPKGYLVICSLEFPPLRRRINLNCICLAW